MAPRIPSAVAGNVPPVGAAARARVRAAIRLVHAAAGDADLGSVTPSVIAAAIREARRALEADSSPAVGEVAELLQDALDTVEDGLPPDDTEALLDRASRLLR